MDNSAKNANLREKTVPLFFGQTSELNSYSYFNYEYFSDDQTNNKQAIKQCQISHYPPLKK